MEDPISSELPRVGEFFQSGCVFVTGATGFMGKVLLEKLLRSCPGIEHIFIVIRSKKGDDAATRLKTLFHLPLFDRLREEQPLALDKVVAMNGDITEVGLGLSQQDRQTLIDKVTVIFNVAATVRFDEPIKAAVLMNVRGPREVLDMALQMKQLKVVLHVSTTYCNTDKKVIEEKIYPPHGNWQLMIKAAETMDRQVLEALIPKLMGFLPNTYTYTKSLGEHVVNDYGHKLPVVIFRPAIVISTHSEPIAGWIDNFNGPIGVMVAGGKGFVRTLYADPEVNAGFMPVDLAIKAMVVAAWRRGTMEYTTEVPVYNSTVGNAKVINYSQAMEKAKELSQEIPLNNILWYPGGGFSRTYAEYYFRALFLHMLPAMLIDLVLPLLGIQPLLVKLQRRIFIANTALRYFLHHEWDIRNECFLKLDNYVLDQDRREWSFDFQDYDVHTYLRNCFAGARQYLLKEDISTMPEAKIHYRRMYWIDKLTRMFALLMLAWVLHANSVFGRTATAVTGYWNAFLLVE